MEKKLGLVLLLFVLSLALSRCSAADWWLSKKATASGKGGGASVIFRVEGNVYPEGLYYVTFYLGTPPKAYYLDLDTGSDLTWLQCDAPCASCNKVPHPLYKPNKKNLVFCEDQICASLDSADCNEPKEQCDYSIEYADHGSSLGVLIRDIFQLRLTNGSVLAPSLAFGCGYNQQGLCKDSVCPTDGVLGLGNGKGSIISQLKIQGLTNNVIGHCLSGQGGGYLFFGDDIVPSSGVIWTPMSPSTLDKHYSPGPADLGYGGKPTAAKGLRTIFDSGSSYTYFNSMAYEALISAVKKVLTGKPLKEAAEDQTLPLCWKGEKRFKSTADVKKYFSSATLSFKKVKLEIAPESYLIISSGGNVCLGILNGTQIGLDDLNLIGDNSMLNKMVIYDNEKQRIGWISTDCNKLPKMDRDVGEACYPTYTDNLGLLPKKCPAKDEL